MCCKTWNKEFKQKKKKSNMIESMSGPACKCHDKNMITLLNVPVSNFAARGVT